MLNIEYEFKKGFFFTRLSGNINKKNYSYFIKDFNNIIDVIGLNNIVINLNFILGIDSYILDKFLKDIYKKYNQGIMIYLCDNKSFVKNNNIFLKIYSECEVYDLI